MKLVFLALCLGVATAYPAGEYSDNARVDSAIARIKNYMLTDDGVQLARDYISELESQSPATFMVKAFVEGSTSEFLKDLLSEILKDIPHVELTPEVDIHAEFHIFGEFEHSLPDGGLEVKLRTDGGILALQQYFEDLQTSHQIVHRLKTLVINADAEHIRDIVHSFLPSGEYAGLYAYVDRVDIALTRIKSYLNTDEGVQLARDYIAALETDTPMSFMVKAFVDGATTEFLKGMLNEVLKDIPDHELTSDVDIHEEFHIFGEFLRTDEGIVALKQYFQDLSTSHQIILRLKTMVINADEEHIREIVHSFLPSVDYYSVYEYDVNAELRRLFYEIRVILISPEGLQTVRDYARELNPTHPVLFLVKAFISGADDKILLEILDEVFKGLSGSGYYESVARKLESLFIQVKEIYHSEEGFAALKNYLVNIQTVHPIVSRLVEFIKNSSDDTLRDIVGALFGQYY